MKTTTAPATDICPEELSAWLRLTLEPKLKPAQVRSLLAAFGLPQHIHDAAVDTLSQHVPEALAVQLHQPPSEAITQKIQTTLDWLAQPNRHLLTLADAQYPPLLLNLPRPPLLLYVQGRLDCLQSPSLAIVGARNATPGGCDNARAFARHLAARGWHIISGLAHGIDAAAHKGALQAGAAGGGTVAVMGTGLDIVYPAANLKLAHRIAEHGALVSEYPLGARALAHHFPQRNRIVAGLAQGVLVVEAAKQSGSLITARLASETGREVFAIPGSIHSPLSRGCHALIRQGAKLVESGQDIIEEMLPQALPNMLPDTASIAVQSAADTDVSCADAPPADDPVLAALSHDPADADTLQTRCNLPTSELHAALTQLELEGHITRLADGRWQRMA